MAHFTHINKNNGIVTQVIVAEQSFIDSGTLGDPSEWVQTSYNTREGKHKLNGMPLRKNYAAVGYTYDKARDAFLPPKPFKSWVLDEKKGTWTAPVVKPADKKFYEWNEERVEWVLGVSAVWDRAVADGLI